MGFFTNEYKAYDNKNKRMENRHHKKKKTIPTANNKYKKTELKI